MNQTESLTTVQPMKFSKLPNLIIIGAMKCGTTSLHHYLNLHPQISMSRHKELDFFIPTKKWKKGLEWYESHFNEQAEIRGEASPNYTNYPYWSGVAEKIYSVVPDAKLIYLVRDPIERIISHYVHQYAAGKEDRTINQALTNFTNNQYIARSQYYQQLNQYLQCFPAENILVLSLENLSTQTESTLKIVLQFLNLDPGFDFKTGKVLHSSDFKRRKNQYGELIADKFFRQFLKKLPPEIRFHLEKIVYFPFSQKVEKPEVDPDLSQKLKDYLKPDIDQLRQHTGQHFSSWCI